MLLNSMMHRRAPTVQNYLDQDVNSAEVEERAFTFPAACPSPADALHGCEGVRRVICEAQKLYLLPTTSAHSGHRNTAPKQTNQTQKKRKKKKKIKYGMVPLVSPTFHSLGECCRRMSSPEGWGQSVQARQGVSGSPAPQSQPLGTWSEVQVVLNIQSFHAS